MVRWRERVVFCGKSHGALKAELITRNCRCESEGALIGRAADILALDRAHIFQANPKKLSLLRDQISPILSTALDHGILLVVLASSPSEVVQLRRFLKSLPGSDRVILRAATPLGIPLIAEEIARHDPGPGANTQLEIKIPGVTTEETALFQRAFADCKTLALYKLAGGLSAAVYCAYAHLPAANAGTRPLPFFIKIDSRQKIDEEEDRYERFVDGFVPFNNRPQLARGRCWNSSTLGILVGSFVDESEPLWDALRRDMGAAAIHSLFDRALRAWRLQAFTNPAYLSSAKYAQHTMLDSLEPREERERLLRSDRVPASQDQLATQLGSRRSVAEVARVLSVLGPIRHRVGIIHGDLHSQNIRVHDGNSILIDFSRACVGPLALDPAALEIDLVFRSFHYSAAWETASSSVIDPKEAWSQFVNRVYEPQFLRNPPPPALDPGPREWLWNSVRKIRIFALADCVSETEYLTAMACQLFRYGSYPGKDEGDSFRRAYALRCADLLLDPILHPASTI
jgi:hypothetical protein